MWLCARDVYSEKLATFLDPLERRSGVFAPRDLHVVLAKHSTDGGKKWARWNEQRVLFDNALKPESEDVTAEREIKNRC